MSSDKKEFVLPAKTTLQQAENRPSILVECGGEYILPDYMPKVQKVLRIEAQVIPPSRYMSVSEAQMSGDVLHTLIYMGEDGEPGATVLPAKYEFSVPLADSEGAPMVITDMEVDTVTYRLSAPRKLNIRTRLSAKPTVIKNLDITEQQKPADIAALHKLYDEIDSIYTVVLNSSDITISDSVSVNVGENAHLIWCGSNAAVSDVKVSDGGVNVRGEVIVKIMLEDSGNMKIFTKKIPFDEFVDGEVSRGAMAIAMPHVISTEAGKDNDNNIMVDVVLGIKAICDTPKRIPVLRDAYSEIGTGIIEYSKVPTEKLVIAHSGIHSVGISVPKNSTGVESIMSVIDTSGRAVLDEVASNGKLIISGRCLLNSICKQEDDSVTSIEYTVPFKIDFEREIKNGITPNVTVSLMNARARVDGDSIVCDMDISVNARAIEKGSENMVSSMDYTSLTLYKKSENPLCLIYPNGESLWALAKKNHVSPESLLRVNSLDIAEKDYSEPSALAHMRSMMLELK